MIVAVCVAAWTTERTFARDLDRQRWRVAREDASPRGNDTFHRQSLYTRGTSVTLKTMIERRKSKIHGWGVYATATIHKNTRIVHYAGEKISNQESLKRERRYIRRGHIWCFKLTNRTVIDAG